MIIQRKTKEHVAFYEETRQTLQQLPKPPYSYNAEFERNIMEIELGMHVKDHDLVDIMKPWKEQANNHGLKWPKLDELISEPEDYFRINKISGKDIPGLWKRYLSEGNESILRKIMERSLSDILRETVLLIRYQK